VLTTERSRRDWREQRTEQAVYAIVSLLDNEYQQQVEDLWAEMRHKAGIRCIYSTPFPHFSYQVADHYDTDRLAEVLRELAVRYRPFTVRTGGLGIFTGPNPVLYIPVVRTLAMSRLHAALWAETSQMGTNLSAYYEPTRWMPHITLGQDGLDGEKLSSALALFRERMFVWEIPVTNIALICDMGTRQELLSRYNLAHS